MIAHRLIIAASVSALVKYLECLSMGRAHPARHSAALPYTHTPTATAQTTPCPALDDWLHILQRLQRTAVKGAGMRDMCMWCRLKIRPFVVFDYVAIMSTIMYAHASCK